MTKKPSTYVAKPVDANGIAAYTAEENAIWNFLITRQTPLLFDRACDEYLHGVQVLNIPQDRIPQCPEISVGLKTATGWQLEPVPALIPFEKFFTLLANKKFPAATFIRRREELDYLQEPDIFHEIFGHCPMLTNPACAEFTQAYGALALNAAPADRAMLAKIYWFTIEFGLINTSRGLKIYGGGILSSQNETLYCLNNKLAIHKPFDVLEILRTPYRIDIMQPIYYVIENFDVLFKMLDMNLLELITEARRLGMHAPIYSLDN